MGKQIKNWRLNGQILFICSLLQLEDRIDLYIDRCQQVCFAHFNGARKCKLPHCCPFHIQQNYLIMRANMAKNRCGAMRARCDLDEYWHFEISVDLSAMPIQVCSSCSHRQFHWVRHSRNKNSHRHWMTCWEPLSMATKCNNSLRLVASDELDGARVHTHSSGPIISVLPRQSLHHLIVPLDDRCLPPIAAANNAPCLHSMANLVAFFYY